MSAVPAGGDTPADGDPAAATDSRQLTVPAPPPGTAHILIEYPGYVGDEQRVLETLGGAAGLASQLQENPKALPLKFRPRDKHCHATYGAREPTRRLLLKLTRPAGGESGAARQGASGSSDAWTAEVVATLPHSYRFSLPADFQYVGVDSRPVEEQGLEQQQDVLLPGFAPQPLLCTPPLFAKQPVFDYGFRGFVAAQAPGASGQAGTTLAGSAAKRKPGTGVMASFFDLEVPQPLPEAAIAAAARHQGDALRLLRRLLQQRPVWPAAALQEAYAEAAGVPLAGGRSGADDLLPKLCFKFRNGPWKNAWTRRGFDPRSTPAAWRWQCVEYHLPSEWYARIAEQKKRAALAKEAAAAAGTATAAADGNSGQQGQQRQRQRQGGNAEDGPTESEGGPALPPLATSYRQLARFEAAPATQSTSLQLGMLADSAIHELLEDPANHAQHCTDTSGWLSLVAYDGIKRRIKERFQAVLDGMPIEDGFEPPEDMQGVLAGEAEQQQQGQQQQQQQQEGRPPAAQQQGGQPPEEEQRGRRKGKAKRRKDRQQQQEQPAGAIAEAEAEAMQVDASPDAAAAAGTAGAAGTGVDQLAQQAQQLNIQQEQREQQDGQQPGGAQPDAAAAAGAAQQATGILPTGLLASVADHLAHLQEEESDEGEEGEEGEEDEEDDEDGEGGQTDEGEGYATDEGYQTEEGGAAGSEQDERG
ncbi:hypothetical protein ABPG77_009185 [Micractinium sp. CCAP 211/92]